MSKLSPDTFKCRLMALREFERKTSPKDAAEKINILLGKEIVCESEIRVWFWHFENKIPRPDEIPEWFKRFDNMEINIFEQEYFGPIVSYQNKSRLSSCQFYNSLWTIINGSVGIKGLIVKEGRFWIQCTVKRRADDSEQGYICIHDLIQGTEKKTPISFNPFHFDLTLVDDYLFAVEDIYSRCDDNTKFHILKIDFKNMTAIKELETPEILSNLNYNKITILPNQLKDEDGTVSCIFNKSIMCQIKETGEVLLEEKEGLNYEHYYSHGARLIGNSLQSFTSFFYLPDVIFCERNLDTMEKKEINVPIILDNDDLGFLDKDTYIYDWSSDDKFYGMFEVHGKGYFKLLTFDLKTLKWGDVKLEVRGVTSLFVDGNGILTFGVQCRGSSIPFYQFALRSPDKLMNLTKMATVRESNLYKNDKYIKAAKKLCIEF